MSPSALRGGKRRAVLAVLALLLAATGVGTATGAIVEVENIVLHADGGFQPQLLPRNRFVPIDFQGHLDIDARDGGEVQPLQQALIDFDRDGRLSVAGLPTCAPESIAEVGTEEARRICKGAMVGTGNLEVMVTFLDQSPTRSRSQLTIFNGPRLEGHPTAVLHARLTTPATQTYAILVPIEKRRGAFRYRARLDLPPLAGGAAAITHIDIEIGRRYRAGGKPRSYVSARCRDNILQTHGRFTFGDGTVIDGLVEKYCRDK
jgi:hypothetical protein